MMCSQLQRCKPAVMALTGILLLVTALRLLSLTAGKPANARASGPGAPARTYQCSSFSNAICNSLDGKGYNHAAFPNPLSSNYLPTVQTAQDQASIYIPLAVASGCSSRVAKFLCFSFFPLCVEATPSIPPVFPCPSFCRKVKADCEPYLMARYATSWPQWLDCDDMERVLRDSQSLCVNETEAAATTALPTMTTSTPVQLTATTRLPPISGSSNPTTPPPLSTAAPVCEVCNPRTNVTSGTFRVAVNNYTFAAKVMIEAQTVINHVITYTATVINQYLPNCSYSAQLPRSGALITTYSDQCSPCFEMQSGQIYVIGGYYYSNDDGGSTWVVPRKRGVVAPWMEKYESKLDKWMKAAADDRMC